MFKNNYHNNNIDAKNVLWLVFLKSLILKYAHSFYWVVVPSLNVPQRNGWKYTSGMLLNLDKCIDQILLLGFISLLASGRLVKLRLQLPLSSFFA